MGQAGMRLGLALWVWAVCLAKSAPEQDLQQDHWHVLHLILQARAAGCCSAAASQHADSKHSGVGDKKLQPETVKSFTGPLGMLAGTPAAVRWLKRCLFAPWRGRETGAFR